jgi:hypothetical protein
MEASRILPRPRSYAVTTSFSHTQGGLTALGPSGCNAVVAPMLSTETVPGRVDQCSGRRGRDGHDVDELPDGDPEEQAHSSFTPNILDKSVHRSSLTSRLRSGRKSAGFSPHR